MLLSVCLVARLAVASRILSLTIHSHRDLNKLVVGFVVNEYLQSIICITKECILCNRGCKQSMYNELINVAELESCATKVYTRAVINSSRWLGLQCHYIERYLA